MKAAHDLVTDFEHGACLVELASLSDAALVPSAVANALQSFGVQPKQLPLTPDYIWGLVQAAQQKAAE
jgi:predicted ATPase